VTATAWPAETGRICGVSSFGFSGTNAHLVLGPPPVAPSHEQAAGPSGASITPDRPLHVLTLSAGDPAALTQLAGSISSALASDEALADIAFTTNTGRAALSQRIAIVADRSVSTRSMLADVAAGGSPVGVSRGDVGSTDRRKIAFLFTGQGSQYAMMGRGLYQTQRVFRDTIDRCDEILRSELHHSLRSVLYANDAGDGALIHDTSYAQPALFAIEYALAELLESWGVRADAMLGHSVGEYVAATRAGVFSLDDGLRLIAVRGRLMGALPAGGAMAAVVADGEAVHSILASSACDGVSVAAYNGPENTVISGPADAVNRAMASLAAAGVSSQSLTVSHAFHSELMDPVLAEFERVASSVDFNAPRGKLISNLTGHVATLDTVGNAEYWRRHLREPVQFATAMKTLAAQGIGAFVEIGPHPVLG
jgi:acyl transferase domain-containing protein